MRKDSLLERRGRQLRIGFRIALVAVLWCVPLAGIKAVPLIGTDGTKLYKFDSATPGTVTTVTLSGLIAGDTLIGIDYHPVTGQLYGVGLGRIYTINAATGAVTSVGGSNPDFAPSGGTFATDISPLDDQVVRVVSNTHQNLRINLSNATVASTDASLTYTGNPSNIAAISYSNGFRYASTTTCFGIGAGTQTEEARLLRIGSVNGSPTGAETGVVTKLGSLGLGAGLNQNIGFDIAPNGTAYAAIVFGGQLRLYTVNLSTGAATLVAPIAGGASSFRGLTAEAGRKQFSNTSLIRIPRIGPDNENILGAADPYPSNVSVSGQNGVVTSVRVTINDFRHTEPRDTSMLLVSPDGTRKMNIWAGVGRNYSTCGACDNNTKPGNGGPFITMDDNGVIYLPKLDPLNSFDLFKPTNHEYSELFVGEWGGTQVYPAPAPGGPYGYAGPFGTSTFTNAFFGTSPNGNWSLYVRDGMGGTASTDDPTTGRIASGWTIALTTGPACTLSCSDLTRSAAPGMCGTMVNYPVPNVSGACGTLTYSIPSGSMFPVGTTPVEVTSQFGQKCTFNVKVEDFQPPTISCNQDITVQAGPGATSAVVTFPGPTASDNCSGLVASYNPPSGSSFPVGTTTVTGEATDASQTSVKCTFKVTVLANNATPTPTPPNSGSKLANLSTRLRVETGDSALIGGFIITGGEAKRLIVRAIGPSIPVPGALANPLLQVFDSNGGAIATNDNWQDAPNQQEIANSTIAPPNNLESAFLSTLNPGAYTAAVSGVGGATGVGLVEVYDLNLNANARLANISTRGLVQTGDDVLIAGTIVLGQAAQNVIVRAIGPSLPIAGRLENPTLELRDSNGGLLEANDNWIDSPNKQAIINTTIPPANDLESAIVGMLPANGASYTAIVRGVNNTTGLAVVEIYALQ